LRTPNSKKIPSPPPPFPFFFFTKNTRRLCGHVASPHWLGGGDLQAQVPTSANQQKEKVMHTQDPITIELIYFHYIVVGPTTTTTTIGEGRDGGKERRDGGRKVR